MRRRGSILKYASLLNLGAHEKAKANDRVHPYLELVQVPLVEKTQVCRDNSSKGTRNFSPVTSEEGVPALARAQVAITRGERLFIKNTNHRRAETLSTMVDACSLPVPEHRVQPGEGLVKSGGNSDPLKVA